MTAALVAMVLAGGFLMIGRWGRRNAAALVPVSYSEAARAREERSLRRGGRSLMVLGWVFMVLGAVVAVASMVSGTTR